MEKRQPQGLTTYAYDSMNRLSVVEYPGGKEELFYDRAGNRTRRVCGGEEELYRYDSRNRLTEHTRGGVTKEYKYDNAGNLLEDGRARYEYDALNRNTKVETLDGNIQVNRYDAEGLRHEMEENGELVSFIFRDREVVAEESQAGMTRYIRTGELLASDAEYARTYYHYASDEMGSITHVVADGEVLNRYEYDAWGNPTVCEETVPNRFRFNGQQYDPITQQYYLRARYYNPVIGRFTQEDTYRGDGLNLYAYCRNNPVCYVDPSGHMTCKEARKTMREAIRKGWTLQDLDASVASQLKAWYDNKTNHGGLKSGEKKLAGQIGLEVEGGSSSRYDRAGYHSSGRSNNLFGRDRSTRRTINLTEWRRSISRLDIHNEMRLFLGDDYVKIDSGKWRSLDGTRQFRVKPDDYLGNHGIGQPIVPNTSHIHFEFLVPRSNGNGFDVIRNIHVPISD